MDFKTKYNFMVEQVNKALDEYVVKKNTPEKIIYDAMRYSLMAGGKRLRPILAMAVCEMLDGNMDEVMPFACAIEMIHTYSLIHDDLPVMDNDDYRRGMLTNHKVYGEAMAVLAGDSLLNFAFEILSDSILSKNKNVLEKVSAMNIIAKASGASGMIGGQVVDLESEGEDIDKDLLEYMHRYKTGAMIKASVLSAAALCKAKEGEFECLENYAEKLGLAFQIKDDILDIEGSTQKMGKNTGSDVANKKSTFVSIYGIEKSKKMLQDLTIQAVESLEEFGEKAYFLKSLSNELLNREH